MKIFSLSLGKKLTALVLSITLFCTILAGCNGIAKDVEQTNKVLTVYDTVGHQIPSEVITKYNQLYPDVKLKVEFCENQDDIDTYVQKMQADIMTGKGPDLIYLSKYYFREVDVEKMMRTGVFADMAPFVKEDKEFNYADYNEGAMKLGVVDGKRYIMPVFYNIPIFLTTESILDKTGFDVSKCTDFWQFSDELIKYSQSNIDAMPRPFTRGIRDMAFFYNYASIPVTDYEDKSSRLDTPELKRGADSLKDMCSKNPWRVENYDGNDVDALCGEKALLANYSNASFGMMFDHSFDIVRNGQKPVFFPVRDVNGKIQGQYDFGAAITNNSPNKQNAYNFVKLLLSMECQDGFDGSASASFAIPVLNSAVDATYEKWYKDEVELFDGTSTFIRPPLPKEVFNQYIGYLKDVTGISFNSNMHSKLNEIMLQYYEGKKSYEECIKEAQNSLEIYMSE